MGQTRRETVRAAATIGAPSGDWNGLPIVGSAPSGDDFTDKPNFFRTAPTNKRQAEVGVKFLADRFANRHVWVLSDSGDLYSSGLAGDYGYLLASGTPFPQVDSRMYSQDDSGTVDVFRPIVGEICTWSRRQPDLPPLVVYTGRANEANTLLRDLQDDQQGCPGKAVVMGGDDLSQLETSGYNNLKPEDYAGDLLYFTTFGPTLDGWKQITRSDQVPGFFDEYRAAQSTEQARGGSAFATAPNGHIMLAYDAVSVLLTGVEHARENKNKNKDPGKLPDRADVSRELRKLTGFRGAAGVIDYTGAGDVPPAGRDPADKLVVVQKVSREGNGVVSRYETYAGTAN